MFTRTLSECHYTTIPLSTGISTTVLKSHFIHHLLKSFKHQLLSAGATFGSGSPQNETIPVSLMTSHLLEHSHATNCGHYGCLEVDANSRLAHQLSSAAESVVFPHVYGRRLRPGRRGTSVARSVFTGVILMRDTGKSETGDRRSDTAMRTRHCRIAPDIDVVVPS